MSAAIIHIHDLSKTYFTDAGVNTVALHNVSIDINRGEFVAIMGASGSGKSTLLNLLGCLDVPTSGTYTIDGADVSTFDADGLATLRRNTIGFVFQNFNLLPRRTVLDNVALPLICSGYAKTLCKSKASDMLIRVGLANRASLSPSQLSGGQQQRVAIARALINNPVLILADEPTGNLDSTTSDEIMGLFTELNRSGITIVMVTHEADVAAFAQRVIVMRDGHVVEDKRQSQN